MTRRTVASLVLLAVCLVAAATARAAESDLSTRPIDGMRSYHLLASPEAKGQANLPLVLYLSPPAGPELEGFQKDWWPGLKERRCVVAIPLSRPRTMDSNRISSRDANREAAIDPNSLPRMWMPEDGNYVEAVLADVRKEYRTDPKRILLLGVSGGGQMALYFADRAPEMFRAVVAVSTNPVIARGSKSEWFYPADGVLKTCPYFVINPLTEGAALRYWRQVKEKLAPRGASITVWPVVSGAGGDANAVGGHYLPPPMELWPWLDAVLAGRQPAALADPQQSAVAKMFEKPVAALVAGLEKAQPAASTQSVAKELSTVSLAVPVPKDFERSKREDATDAAGRPMIQVRLEHAKDAVYVRAEARQSKTPMAGVLAEEANQTAERGLLYQVFAKGKLDAGGRKWEYQIGSITFPHKERGWQSTLFFHAWAATAADGREWLEVTVLDETQEPDGGQLLGAIKAVLGGIQFRTAAPSK